MVPFPSYHLWLKPSGDLLDALSETIERLSCRLGGPVFTPHITLLGSVPGTEGQHRARVEALAAQMKPFDVVLDQPCTGTEYFESVFMQVRPNEPLVSANALACRLFGAAAKPYRPHLSIVYGEFTQEQKQEVIPDLTVFVGRSLHVDRFYLIQALSREPADWHQVWDAAMSEPAKRN